MAMYNNRRAGVIETIRECLFRASESQPVTKAQILDVLVERFPERGRDSMHCTVAQQVPNKLGVAGYHVQKNSLGYWLESEQSENTAATKRSGSGSRRSVDRSDTVVSLPVPQVQAPQTIRIDPEVWTSLQRLAVPFVEKTPNDVLRRILGLSPG